MQSLHKLKKKKNRLLREGFGKETSDQGKIRKEHAMQEREQRDSSMHREWLLQLTENSVYIEIRNEILSTVLHGSILVFTLHVNFHLMVGRISISIFFSFLLERYLLTYLFFYWKGTF